MLAKKNQIKLLIKYTIALTFIFTISLNAIASTKNNTNNHPQKSQNNESNNLKNVNLSKNYFSLAPMLKKSMPSIVAISGIKRLPIPQNNFYENNPNDPYPNSMANQNPNNYPENQIAIFIGSGIIVNAEKGYILTNAHVIEGLDEIRVTLNDKRKFYATVIGTDIPSDLALIKIEATNLKEIKFADSDKLETGDFVVAIGNPFGLSQTVTSGIISALGRTDVGSDGFFDLIQTDAALNMGNSGGGLLNLNGELIGVITGMIAPPTTRTNIGLGFAIPINMAKKILLQLINVGHVARGIFGVLVQSVDSNLAEAFGLNKNQGAIITEIIPKSPADKANLQIGDVIIEFNKKEVQDPIHLRTLVSFIPPGTKATIKISRDKKIINLPIEIIDPRDNYTDGKTIASGLNGSWLEETTPQNANIPGVRIIDIEPKTPISQTELKIGDIIVAANKIKINSIKNLKKAVKKGDFLLLQVIRNKSTIFIAIKK